MEVTVTAHSATETKGYGKQLAPHLLPGDVLALQGDLGAGKTTFCQGVGEGLGITTPIVSPTFTIIREYAGRLPYYHFDVYRLEGIEELDDLGFEEYFYGDGVVVIEWANLIRPVLPEDHLEISLSYGGGTSRVLRFVAHGPRSEELLESAGIGKVTA